MAIQGANPRIFILKGVFMKTIYASAKIKYLSLIFLSFIFLSCAESKRATADEMNHTFILSFPGISKTILYEKTIKWIGLNFHSAKSVIDVQDKEAGNIIAKGYMDGIDYGGLLKSNCYFTLQIDIKDNKERLVFIPTEISILKDIQTFRDYSNMHNGAQQGFIRLKDNLNEFIKAEDSF
jgi:hypothetical protein